MEARTLLLNHGEIVQRIHRMAWQLYETNTKANKLFLIGIAKKGVIVNKLIAEQLREICDLDIIEISVNIDKNQPSNEMASLDSAVSLKGEAVVLVDDVLNSGKTMMYASLPILAHSPNKLQTCVLANRDHKRFPVLANFVGISLSTTLQEHISFEMDSKNEMSVYLS